MNKQLIFRYLSGSATSEEKAAVMEWSERSAENEAYLIEIKRLWSEATRNTQRNAFDSYIDFQEISKKTGIDDGRHFNGFPVRWSRIIARAAIWLLVVGLTFSLGYIVSNVSPGASGEKHHLVAEQGHVSEIILEDGTRVWLNSGSEMAFPVSMKRVRSVELSGEAYFEVFHDAKRPFLVNFEYGTIEVKGTRFNISCYPEDEKISAVLVEGKVDWIMPGSRTITLKPNEKVTLDRHSSEITRNMVDSDLYFGWIENRFVFNNDKLSDIVKELERWYRVEFIVKDKALESQEFSGIFPKTVSVKSFLKVLASTGVKYKIIEGPDNTETIELYR